MISAQDIAAWRPFAPWSTDLMVEQDFLLSRAVELIFEDTFLGQQVVMRGGTVLHKSHLQPASRYSEDIDLVLVGERPGNHIEKALKRVLKPLLGKPAESFATDVRLAIRNLVMKSKIIRQKYVYSPHDSTAVIGNLKIEVNINEAKSCFDLVDVPMMVPISGGGTKNIVVKSYDLDEMLGTKMRALLQREHGRDLYDLWRAWDVSQDSKSATSVKPERVGEAFRFYMSREQTYLPKTEIEQELKRRMNSPKFLNDMDGYLPADQPYSPQTAYEVFQEIYLPYLDV